MLEKLGVIFIDNNTATAEQTMKMTKLLAELPRAVWDVETITVRGWLEKVLRNKELVRERVSIFFTAIRAS